MVRLLRTYWNHRHHTATWERASEAALQHRTGPGRSGIRSQQLTHRFDRATLDEIVQRYQDGTGMKPLAAEYGISDWSVRALLKQHGIASRPTGSHSQ